MKKNTNLVLGFGTILMIIVNFYTSSYVINDGNYPVWWNIIFIVVVIFLALGLFKLLSKNSKVPWKSFLLTCLCVFLFLEIYHLTFIV